MVCIILLSGCGQHAEAGYEIQKYTSFRDIPGVTDEEIAAIEEFRKQGVSFVFGTIPSTESYIGEDGEFSGFTALLCEWLTELFDIPFEPRIFEWSDMLAGLESGEVDFSGELTATEERRKTYIMTDPIAERLVKYIRIANSAPLSYVSMLYTPRFAFLSGTTTEGDVSGKFEGEFEVFHVSNYDEAYRMLKDGEIDAFIDEGPAEEAFDIYGDVVVENFYPLIYSPVSLATQKKENETIISVFQKALQNDGNNYLTELYNIGMNDYRKHKLHTSLTKEELAYIESHPVIRFVAEHDDYPISFYNTYDEEFQGIFFDVLLEIEELTGFSFELLNDQSADWTDILKMLEDGDAALISELIRTPERAGRFLWPETAVLTDYHALLSKTDLRSININEVVNMRVGLVHGSAQTELFNQWFPNHRDIVMFANFNQAFDALSVGEVDMVMGGQNQILVQTNFRELTGYKANIIFDYPFESTFGFNKDETVLCSIIDKTLRHIDTYNISGQWTRKVFDYSAKLNQAQRPLLISIIVLLLFVIVIFLYALWLAKKSASTKQLAMEASMKEQIIAADNAALDRLNRMKNELIATVTHETKTPLTVLTGYSELIASELRRKGVDEQTAKDLDKIAEEAQRIAGLMDRLSGNISKNENSRAKTMIDLADLLYSTARLYMPILERKQTALAICLPDDLPKVYACADEITQVVFNLLQNARNHTENGEVVITAASVGDCISVTVSDTGSGIRPEVLPGIFDRGVSYTEMGSGLGLYISKEIIESHGGTIKIESEPGKGTAVCFTLPVEADMEKAGQWDAMGAEPSEAEPTDAELGG